MGSRKGLFNFCMCVRERLKGMTPVKGLGGLFKGCFGGLEKGLPKSLYFFRKGTEVKGLKGLCEGYIRG